MWGIIPAAGKGSRIPPLAFPKELLPDRSRKDGPVERPRAASEYLIERMVLAGAINICFVMPPVLTGKPSTELRSHVFPADRMTWQHIDLYRRIISGYPFMGTSP
jgi:dTDP-glucose pyrophosphorylase